MKLTKLAEIALPKQPPDAWRMIDVLCALCGFDHITIEDDQVVCGHCRARVCVLCGCVDEIACISGCYWLLPGVCSTHEGDKRLARVAIPATPTTTLSLLN